MRRLNVLCTWWVGILAGMLFMYACSATVEASGDFETVGTAGGFQVKVTPTAVTCDAAPQGGHLDIQARDAQGNPIGGPITGFGPGDTFAAVPGAATYTGSPSSHTACTSCTVDNLVTPPVRPPASPHAVGAPVEQILLVIPAMAFTATTPGFGPLSNTYASFSVTSSTGQTADQLWARIAPIVLAPIGAMPAVAPDTTVNFYTKAVPTDSEGADLYIADQTLAFESVTFKLNGQVLATIGYHSETYVLENGWKLWRTRVLNSNLQLDGSEDFSLVADTVEADANGLVGTLTYPLPLQ